MFRWSKALTVAAKSRICAVQNTSKLQLVKHLASSCNTKMGDKFRLPARLGTGEKSVWVEYTQFALEHKPKINLGQGFPDYLPPCHVPKALADLASDTKNWNQHQYTRGFGHVRLIQAISKTYSCRIGKEINPMNEVLITAGAYEALYSAILGLVDTGDEVIVMEPFFDCYDFMIKSAGGVPKFIPLKPKTDGASSEDWDLDWNQLTSMFNEKTKMIIVNTPHNPIGKVFSKEDLEKIANLCKKFNVVCLADEVYEWMVYPPKQHIRMATLPNMWERTITVGSAGKTFSVTGWKIGWAYAPAALMRNMQVVHQNCVYTCCTPIQEALARSFEYELNRQDSPDCLFNVMPTLLQPKRDLLAKTLCENGFKPTVPEGGYFIVADWTPLEKKIDLSTENDKYRDYKFTKKFAKESGVMGIPPTAFYSANKSLGENYVRFCFIKQDENLIMAGKLMTEWNAKKKQKC